MYQDITLFVGNPSNLSCSWSFSYFSCYYSALYHLQPCSFSSIFPAQFINQLCHPQRHPSNIPNSENYAASFSDKGRRLDLSLQSTDDGDKYLNFIFWGHILSNYFSHCWGWIKLKLPLPLLTLTKVQPTWDNGLTVLQKHGELNMGPCLSQFPLWMNHLQCSQY